MYRLSVYVPADALEPLKEALFKAGAGALGAYDRCCWVVKGEGQFRPLPGANPACGVVGQVHRLEEYRIELIVPDQAIPAVRDALLKTHPYETPAYGFVRLES